mgnify:CR=1 FL=1
MRNAEQEDDAAFDAAGEALEVIENEIIAAHAGSLGDIAAKIRLMEYDLDLGMPPEKRWRRMLSGMLADVNHLAEIHEGAAEAPAIAAE